MLIDIKLLEIGGFGAAVETLRLPYGKECRSNFLFNHKIKGENLISTESCVFLNDKDIQLMQSLIRKGDEHAKFARLIQVWVNITAPRYFYQELVTYEVGVTKGCSNSTMHQECKGMSDTELVEFKNKLPEGTMQTRTYMFSYQALRRIYYQRIGHRLPHWRLFCDWIESLPYAKELIICNESEVSNE